jgi:bifunctional DNA-binding transcriptional regulator/antitoxin component of YhaV-PrlF toxin-antitoxin module
MKTALISKITERGQITLPKKMRASPALYGARAVEFMETPHGLTIRAVRSVTTAPSASFARSKKGNTSNEWNEVATASMGDWSKSEDDNIFDMS